MINVKIISPICMAITNLSCFQKEAYYDGIKMFVSNPHRL